MGTKKGITTVGFTYKHISHVEEFCKNCKEVGYKNNESLEAMKLEWCLEQGGQFFLTYLGDKIISLSGCHPLPEAGDSVYRVLFRGATLPEHQNMLGIMSKTHMNSIPFYYHLPRQTNWAVGYSKFVVTTNHSNQDGIVSMNKSHRVFQLLEKQNIVECMHRNLRLFYADQSVWKINLEKYFQAREKFESRHLT
jgi:hypothetical protein